MIVQRTFIDKIKDKAYYPDFSIDKLVVDVSDIVGIMRQCGISVGEGKWILHDVQCPEQYECYTCGTRFIQEQNRCCNEWMYCPACGSKNN